MKLTENAARKTMNLGELRRFVERATANDLPDNAVVTVAANVFPSGTIRGISADSDRTTAD